jgi:hypothetical protein
MSGSTTAMTSSIGVNTSAFWERLWRTSGIQFIALCIIAYIIYGYQPQVGASSDALVAFYHGHQTPILNSFERITSARSVKERIDDLGNRRYGRKTARRSRSFWARSSIDYDLCAAAGLVCPRRP